VHPIAFQLGPLTVTWFGVMMALAFVAGLWTASRRALSQGVPSENILDLGTWLIIGIIVGARALYVISYWHEQFAEQPWTEVFKVWRGGLVFYGGLIGASVACILFARIKKLPMLKLGDIMAPSIPLGSAFGRVGCLLNGCCYGRECRLPWAIHFPYPHPTYPHGVHPTEVYDSLLNLAFYGLLAWAFRRKKFDGQIFAIYLVGYALLRSFVEMFRGDYPQYYLGGWATPAQVVSIGTLAVGLALLWWLPRPAASASTPLARGTTGRNKQ
jgi:phosphatidylglycerol:prolipoprotein diacylglycerol transferase